jgi:hypothetical protein
MTLVVGIEAGKEEFVGQGSEINGIVYGIAKGIV